MTSTVRAPLSYERLRVLIDAGLIVSIPTHFQLWQGEIEMAPYVLSSDATVEEGYVGTRFGTPWLRQPIIFSQVGRDHFRIGCALDAKLSSVCTHLQLTYHRGMPVFDLQVIQTHPSGLDVLERSIVDILTVTSDDSRRRRHIAKLILANPDEYLAQFLGPQGWIERARHFDYPPPTAEGSAFPEEFYSLAGFLNYCARTFPAYASDVRWQRYPKHFTHLLLRRMREGRSFAFWNDASATASARRVRENRISR
ncbi:MAG: hypothetical protein IPK60_00650 [Sandaracinaceae bacterium]|nr:hypothetical protein [Sandaracinaceae bacterium]